MADPFDSPQGDDILSFSRKGRTIRLGVEDVSASTLARVFRISADSVILTSRDDLRTCIPNAEGMFTSLSTRAGASYVVEGDDDLGSSHFGPTAPVPMASSPFGMAGVSGAPSHFSVASAATPLKRPSASTPSTSYSTPAPGKPKTGPGSGTFSKAITVIKFSSGKQKNGLQNFETKQTMTVRLPQSSKCRAEMANTIATRLEADGVKEPIILMDSSFNPLSSYASADDLRAPNKKIFVSTVRNYEKYFGFGSASKSLSEKLADSPVKKKAKVLSISDSDSDYEQGHLLESYPSKVVRSSSSLGQYRTRTYIGAEESSCSCYKLERGASTCAPPTDEDR